MSNVVSFQTVLEDSNALAELAEDAGITPEAVRKVLAKVATMPAHQAIRLCYASYRHELAIRRRSR